LGCVGRGENKLKVMKTENNKIIAKFMGMKVVNGYLQKYIDNSTEPKQYWEGKSKTFEHQIFGWQITHHESKILYHSDWNWLMEVVEKIKRISNEDAFLDKLDTLNSRISIELERQLESCFRKSYLEIEAVYNACLEFIKWYLENSAKTN
jgi:hypothetical protein